MVTAADFTAACTSTAQIAAVQAHLMDLPVHFSFYMAYTHCSESQWACLVYQ
jgi:hypothetical protein